MTFWRGEDRIAILDVPGTNIVALYVGDKDRLHKVAEFLSPLQADVFQEFLRSWLNENGENKRITW